MAQHEDWSAEFQGLPNEPGGERPRRWERTHVVRAVTTTAAPTWIASTPEGVGPCHRNGLQSAENRCRITRALRVRGPHVAVPRGPPCVSGSVPEFSAGARSPGNAASDR